jgi:hypothetical protein
MLFVLSEVATVIVAVVALLGYFGRKAKQSGKALGELS